MNRLPPERSSESAYETVLLMFADTIGGEIEPFFPTTTIRGEAVKAIVRKITSPDRVTGRVPLDLYNPISGSLEMFVAALTRREMIRRYADAKRVGLVA
jgi:hypothetical protein